MMISKVLSKIGLPILIKFVSSSLGKLNVDCAQKASSALFDVTDAIKKQEISVEQISEVNRHTEKMQEIEGEFDHQTLALINDTIRHEIASEDRFVRFWRPAFGYSVAFAWLLTMSTICYVVIKDYPNAAEIIAALVETTSLWSVALGVLGVSVVKRSQEKQNRKNEDVLSKVINKIT